MSGSATEVLAVIPARGGSKSVPRKNLQPLAGHPLIAYSIAAAARATTVGRAIVSTDDSEIAEVARRYGADVPFMRPAELALDETPDLPVFQHALAWLREEEGYEPDVIVQLRPTSPLRPPGLVDTGVRTLLESPSADCVRGVTPSSQNPFKMWREGPNGSLSPLLGDEFEEPYNMPRQALPPTYWQTGHIDVIRRSTIVEKQSLTGDRVFPLLVESAFCVDIDTRADLDLAGETVAAGRLEIVRPPGGFSGGVLPEAVGLVVFDFDGVFTDDRVWVDQDGVESVVCSRRDGLGLERLRVAGIPLLVISKERNPVVARRCEKLRLECRQGIDDKRSVLEGILRERGIRTEDVVFVGNDVNDVECLALAGCGVAVADADERAKSAAQIVLRSRGGKGAIRELADMLLSATVSREG